MNLAAMWGVGGHWGGLGRGEDTVRIGMSDGTLSGGRESAGTRPDRVARYDGELRVRGTRAVLRMRSFEAL